MSIKTKEQLTRLQWSCRRGMLELDLMLGQFLYNGYAKLSADEQHVFEELLDCMDQDLYSWILGSTQPARAQFIPLIMMIREYAHTLKTL